MLAGHEHELVEQQQRERRRRGDSAPSPTGYEGLCAAYAQSTSNCCLQGAETCSTTKADDWYAYCLGFARRCAGMPTCFSGSDCNTLVYCAGSC